MIRLLHRQLSYIVRQTDGLDKLVRGLMPAGIQMNSLTQPQKLALTMLNHGHNHPTITLQHKRAWLSQLNLNTLSDSELAEAVLLMVKFSMQHRERVQLRANLRQKGQVALALCDLNVANYQEWLELASKSTKDVLGLEILLKLHKTSPVANLNTKIITLFNPSAHQNLMFLMLLQAKADISLLPTLKHMPPGSRVECTLTMCELSRYLSFYQLTPHQNDWASLARLQDQLLSQAIQLNFATELDPELFTELWTWLSKTTTKSKLAKSVQDKLIVGILNSHYNCSPSQLAQIFVAYSSRAINNPPVNRKLSYLAAIAMDELQNEQLIALAEAAVKYVRVLQPFNVKLFQAVQERKPALSQELRKRAQLAFGRIAELVGQL